MSGMHFETMVNCLTQAEGTVARSREFTTLKLMYHISACTFDDVFAVGYDGTAYLSA